MLGNMIPVGLENKQARLPDIGTQWRWRKRTLYSLCIVY